MIAWSPNRFLCAVLCYACECIHMDGVVQLFSGKHFILLFEQFTQSEAKARTITTILHSIIRQYNTIHHFSVFAQRYDENMYAILQKPSKAWLFRNIFASFFKFCTMKNYLLLSDQSQLEHHRKWYLWCCSKTKQSPSPPPLPAERNTQLNELNNFLSNLNVCI